MKPGVMFFATVTVLMLVLTAALAQDPTPSVLPPTTVTVVVPSKHGDVTVTLRTDTLPAGTDTRVQAREDEEGAAVSVGGTETFDIMALGEGQLSFRAGQFEMIAQDRMAVRHVESNAFVEAAAGSQRRVETISGGSTGGGLTANMVPNVRTATLGPDTRMSPKPLGVRRDGPTTTPIVPTTPREVSPSDGPMKVKIE